VEEENKKQRIENTRITAMDMIPSRTSSFARRSAKATPDLELHPFDKVLWARLETMEIDPAG
jgi:hypothetical protein